MPKSTTATRTRTLVNKRAPMRPLSRPTDIYVSGHRAKSSIVPLIKRGLRLLLDDKHPEIYVHGLGAAIPTALSTALAIKERLRDQATVECYTSTTTLYDDILESSDPVSETTEDAAMDSLTDEDTETLVT
ncbi:hypothetical protein IWQ60_012503, partial [Tieghemiomyces parasiticus]